MTGMRHRPCFLLALAAGSWIFTTMQEASWSVAGLVTPHCLLRVSIRAISQSLEAGRLPSAGSAFSRATSCGQDSFWYLAGDSWRVVWLVDDIKQKRPHDYTQSDVSKRQGNSRLDLV